jgi:hypothetical protein
MTLQKYREELRGQADRLECAREAGKCVSDFYAYTKRLILQRLTPELSRPAAAKLGLAEAAKRVRLE